MCPAYLYQAPSGVEGDVTRVDESNVEPAFLITPFPAKYGVAMKSATGGVTPIASGDSAAVFVGLLTRGAPGISQNSANEAIGAFQPNQSEVQNLMVRGYASVKCTVGTPVRGQPVYVRITADTGKAVGDFETGADSGKCVALSATIVGNVTWAADGKDAFNNAEVRIAQ